MYILVNFEILIPRDLPLIQKARYNERIKEDIRNQLSTFRWVQPTKSLFVIECNTERDKLRIVNIFKNFGVNKIMFITSPIIQGKLLGITSEKIWPIMNQIAQEEDDELKGIFGDD